MSHNNQPGPLYFLKTLEKNLSSRLRTPIKFTTDYILMERYLRSVDESKPEAMLKVLKKLPRLNIHPALMIYLGKITGLHMAKKKEWQLCDAFVAISGDIEDICVQHNVRVQAPRDDFPYLPGMGLLETGLFLKTIVQKRNTKSPELNGAAAQAATISIN